MGVIVKGLSKLVVVALDRDGEGVESRRNRRQIASKRWGPRTGRRWETAADALGDRTPDRWWRLNRPHHVGGVPEDQIEGKLYAK